MIRAQNDKSKRWYAVRVRSRHEKKVHKILLEMGIETSLPLITVTRQWSDRSKTVEVPLFSGYVFVMVDIKREYLTVLTTPGVVKFVDFSGTPVVIPERQMYWLQMLTEYEHLHHETTFPSGSAVKVVFGPLLGLQGIVKKSGSGNRLVVWFDAIMQGVSVELDSACLAAVGR